jgi:putative flippase GtrA
VSPRFLRFVAVGVLNTAFSYSIYAVLVWAGMHYAPANLLATMAGIVFSFRTHGTWVFDNRDWRLLRRYVPIWIVLYLLNVGLIGLFVRLGLGPYVAGAIAVPPTVLLGFVLQKRYVFAAERGDSGWASR